MQKPTGTCDAPLISFPLVGEGLVHAKRTWHFCQTRVAGFEPAIWEPKSHALPFGDTPKHTQISHMSV